jgi:hypothetical protein
MDRLPDINRTATPNARPEANDRQPRDNTRATRSRPDDKTGRPDAGPEARVDARQRAGRPDDKSTDRPGRFEVQDAAAARKPAAQPAPDADVKPAAAAEDVAELVAQQPVLRAKAIRAEPIDLAKAPSKDQPATAVPLALPTRLEAIASASEGSASDAPAIELRPVEVHATPRAGVSDATQQPVETSLQKARVEATPPTRETQPVRDVERAADILRQVRVQLVPRTSEAHIQLEPRELGRVSIHVVVEEGRMHASVRAEKREALDAIQAHLPELRATLRDSGITSQDFSFSLGLENQPRRDAQQFSREQQQTNTPAVEARDPEHAGLLRAVAAASGVDLYA